MPITGKAQARYRNSEVAMCCRAETTVGATLAEFQHVLTRRELVRARTSTKAAHSIVVIIYGDGRKILTTAPTPVTEW